MSQLKRREIPIVITAICSVIVVVEYFFKIPTLTNLSILFQKWAVILASFALFIGVVNTLLLHGRKITRPNPDKKDERYLSIWTIAMMTLVVLVGITMGPGSGTYQWIYGATILPLGATIGTLLGFYTFSAAYRSFRARNIEASLLLVTALIVFMYVVPLGELLWGGWPAVGAWLVAYPNAVVGRVLYATVVMGTISLGVRVILGYEKGYLAGE